MSRLQRQPVGGLYSSGRCRWRADVDLPRNFRCRLSLTITASSRWPPTSALTSCLRTLNEVLQMILADVYSQFASRKVNYVAKLSEKHKLMTSRCILKSGQIDWNCLQNSCMKCGMRLRASTWWVRLQNQQQLAGNFCSSGCNRANGGPMSTCGPNAAKISHTLKITYKCTNTLRATRPQTDLLEASRPNVSSKLTSVRSSGKAVVLKNCVGEGLIYCISIALKKFLSSLHFSS